MTHEKRCLMKAVRVGMIEPENALGPTRNAYDQRNANILTANSADDAGLFQSLTYIESTERKPTLPTNKDFHNLIRSQQ